MKVELVTPTQIEDDVVITFSAKQARILNTIASLNVSIPKLFDQPNEIALFLDQLRATLKFVGVGWYDG